MLVRETLLEVSVLRGSYPTIPLPDGMADAFGEEAMFVTLPIGRVGARSRNGRTYTREAVQAIVNAVNANRPEGRWGHLRDEDRPYAYGSPAIRWLAAMIDESGTAWAKGYPVTEEAREHFRVAKIAGSRVGTSVYGFGRMDGDNVVDFELETIDLAAPDRVGIPETAAEPMITSEMKEDNMEITIKDVPETVRQQIIEQYGQKQSAARVSEMETKVTTLTEQVTTLTEQVTTLTTERDAARGEASTLLVTYAKAKIAEQVQLEPVRKFVERMVGIKETDDSASIEGVSTVADLDKVIEGVLADESIQAFNKEAVAEMMGPNWQPSAEKQKDAQPTMGTPIPY